MGNQGREQATAGFAVVGELVRHTNRRPIVDQALDESLLGKEPEFVGERPAGNPREHVLHLVKPARPRDVEGGQDFDAPS